jgi:hypothetical protein
LEKHHRGGGITYSHQMLGATLVHPDLQEVIPLAPEPIINQDGHTKNDCERNATRRCVSVTIVVNLGKFSRRLPTVRSG